MCSYYDLYMRTCLKHSLETGCMPYINYSLDLSADLSIVDCDKFYDIICSNNCGDLFLKDGNALYSPSTGLRFLPCCEDSPQIGYEFLTMSPDQTQNLWVIDPDVGQPGILQFSDKNGAVGCLEYAQESSYVCDYFWEIVSGGGSLSQPSGLSTVYTAPSSNPGCVNNPLIRCFTSRAESFLSIGVNSYSGDTPAYGIYKYDSPCSDPDAYCIDYTEWAIPTPKVLLYNCAGDFVGETTNGSSYWCSGSGCRCPEGAGGSNFAEACITSYNYHDGYNGYYWGKYKDLRTQDMKDNGCCPGILA